MNMRRRTKKKGIILKFSSNLLSCCSLFVSAINLFPLRFSGGGILLSAAAAAAGGAETRKVHPHQHYLQLKMTPLVFSISVFFSSSSHAARCGWSKSL